MITFFLDHCEERLLNKLVRTKKILFICLFFRFDVLKLFDDFCLCHFAAVFCN
jgi:hypothetical protein